MILGVIWLSGCGGKEPLAAADVSVTPTIKAGENAEDNNADGEETLSETDATEVAKTKAEQELDMEAKMAENREKGDVDLTTLSSTMLYSEVYNITMSPEDYIGRKIKVQGIFTVYPGESAEKNHYALLISDAAECCAQGIMFVLAEENVYPDDYPEEGAEVIIYGEYQLYNEDEYFYYHLIGSEIL